MVSKTSLAAYQFLVASGRESTQRAKILAAIINTGAATRRQLSEITRIELGAVAGRVNALIDDGLVQPDGHETDKRTGRQVQVIRPVLVSEPEQSDLDF